MRPGVNGICSKLSCAGGQAVEREAMDVNTNGHSTNDSSSKPRINNQMMRTCPHRLNVRR
jgi:hypothetical protein